MSGRKRVEVFFQAYLAFPVVLLFWAIGYAWKREGWLRTSQIDIDTGRRPVDWTLITAERERIAKKGVFGRIWHKLV
jgi:amino acid transporter